MFVTKALDSRLLMSWMYSYEDNKRDQVIIFWFLFHNVEGRDQFFFQLLVAILL